MTELRYRFLIFLGGIVLVISVMAGTGSMRDNSDYYRRVLRCTGLALDDRGSDFTYAATDPHVRACGTATPMVAVVGAIRVGMAVFGVPKVTVGFTGSVFAFLWGIGLVCAILHRCAWRRPWALAAVVLITAIFSGYFRSLYEEVNVLVLLPVLVLGFWRWQDDGLPGVLLIALALLMLAKVQMVGALPFLLLMVWSKPTSRRAALLMTAVAMTVSLGSLWRWDYTDMNAPNLYDRFYNGIGMALQDVGDWPARTFSARRQYFTENQTGLQTLTQTYEITPNRLLMGSSYYMTGYQLKRAMIEAGRGDDFAAVLAPGSVFRTLKWLILRPQLWPKLAKEVAVVTVTADYRLRYMERQLRLPGLDPIREAARIWGGALMVAVIALIAILRRRIVVPLVFAVTLPAAAWLGSGFFEFEKHMSPYWMLLPLLVAVTYSDNWGRRRLAAPPN